MTDLTTTCTRCKKPKMNGLFTPGKLRGKWPVCRGCVKLTNERKLSNPGAPVGHALRGRSW